MDLDSKTALIIVNQLEKWISGDIWVVNQDNHVLGSRPAAHATAPSHVSDCLRLNDMQPDSLGLNLPLHSGNKEVGRLIIGNSAQQDSTAALMAHKLAELIVHQQALLEQLFDRQWALDKFVHGLVHGKSPDSPDIDASFEDQALLLEIDLNLPRVAVVINVSPLLAGISSMTPEAGQMLSGHVHGEGYARRRLLDQARRFLSDCGHIYSLFDQHQFVILFAIKACSADHADCVRHQVKTIVQSFIAQLGCGQDKLLSAGIGGYYPGWQALAQSYQDAMFAMETGRTLRGPGCVYEVADLGMAGFVCSDSRVVKSDLSDRLLRPLFDKPELMETLETFLNANLSVSVAALQLHLHRHGLTYRLARIYELTGLDPNHFQDAAQLAAALQWHRSSSPNRS